MSEVAKGFRQRRFFDLSDRDKRDILKLMARVAEQAYRRGVQQGAGLADKSSFRGDLWEWRYRPSLDLSPWIDRPTTTTSLDRHYLLPSGGGANGVSRSRRPRPSSIG